MMDGPVIGSIAKVSPAAGSARLAALATGPRKISAALRMRSRSEPVASS
jgi:hypothetical protein